MTTGEKLSKLRKDNNYTQEQLAEIMEVSRQSISKWESNLAYPDIDKLIKLSDLFGCSIDYLLKDNMKNFNNEIKNFKTDDKKTDDKKTDDQIKIDQQENGAVTKKKGYSFIFSKRYIPV